MLFHSLISLTYCSEKYFNRTINTIPSLKKHNLKMLCLESYCTPQLTAVLAYVQILGALSMKEPSAGAVL